MNESEPNPEASSQNQQAQSETDPEYMLVQFRANTFSLVAGWSFAASIFLVIAGKVGQNDLFFWLSGGAFVLGAWLYQTAQLLYIRSLLGAKLSQEKAETKTAPPI